MHLSFSIFRIEGAYTCVTQDIRTDIHTEILCLIQRYKCFNIIYWSECFVCLANRYRAGNSILMQILHWPFPDSQQSPLQKTSPEIVVDNREQ